MTNTHIVLVGDSIFDNQAYVGPGQAVAQQLQRLMTPSGRVTLLAVDGHVASDVSAQMRGFPVDATHVALSVGGNDALACMPALQAECSNYLEALGGLAELQRQFAENYRAAFIETQDKRVPMMVCTIYDAVPGLTAPLKTALSLFNDVISRTALEFQAPVLDLRSLLQDEQDFSKVSPIEPSQYGGEKIAVALSRWLL